MNKYFLLICTAFIFSACTTYPVPAQVEGNKILGYEFAETMSEQGLDLGSDTFLIKYADETTLSQLENPDLGGVTCFITIASLNQRKYAYIPRNTEDFARVLVKAYQKDRDADILRIVQSIKAKRAKVSND